MTKKAATSPQDSIEDLKGRFRLLSAGLAIALAGAAAWFAMPDPHWSLAAAVIIWLIVLSAYSSGIALAGLEAVGSTLLGDIGLIGIIVIVPLLVVFCAVIPLLTWLWLVFRLFVRPPR